MVLTGHADARWAPLLIGLTPGSITIVVLMGLGTRERLVEALTSGGWPRWTPAAIVLAASTPRQYVWRGTLKDLATVDVDAKRDGPGLIVIGDVVALGVEAVAEAAIECTA
jgi:uroporphyrin-III C-methyltransferase/precorrin-2 dehydrogenase/sirohydrochlorin ferrochelatase